MAEETKPPIPNSAMVIMAHPDDPEFFCGGTVAAFTRADCEVSYVVITSGDKGSDDPTMTPERLMETREAEQRAAAEVLGVKRVIYLRHHDGELSPNLALKADIVREIRRWKPEAVLCQDPTTFYFVPGSINHPDHRAAGEAVLAAVFPLARDRLNFPDHEAEGLSPHKVKYVYIFGATAPDTFIDISEVLETKIAAIRKHVSQIKDPDGLAERIRTRSQQSQEGRPAMAEGCRLITLG